MQLIDILLIAAIAIPVVFAVRHVVRKRGACCGCASCCENCKRKTKNRE